MSSLYVFLLALWLQLLPPVPLSLCSPLPDSPAPPAILLSLTLSIPKPIERPPLLCFLHCSTASAVGIVTRSLTHELPSVAHAVGLSQGTSSLTPAVYWSLHSSRGLSCMPLSADLILQNLGSMTSSVNVKRYSLLLFPTPALSSRPQVLFQSPLLPPFYDIQRFEKIQRFVNWVLINLFSMVASGSTYFLVNNIIFFLLDTTPIYIHHSSLVYHLLISCLCYWR